MWPEIASVSRGESGLTANCHLALWTEQEYICFWARKIPWEVTTHPELRQPLRMMLQASGVSASACGQIVGTSACCKVMTARASKIVCVIALCCPSIWSQFFRKVSSAESGRGSASFGQSSFAKHLLANVGLLLSNLGYSKGPPRRSLARRTDTQTGLPCLRRMRQHSPLCILHL